MLAGFGARVHLFVQPELRERFSALFRDTLGCDVHELDFGLSEPIVLVKFPDGSAFSVEFSGLAVPEPPEPIDFAHALRGAWIEFRTGDVGAVHDALDRAGVPELFTSGKPPSVFQRSRWTGVPDSRPCIPRSVKLAGVDARRIP